MGRIERLQNFYDVIFANGMDSTISQITMEMVDCNINNILS